MTFPSRAAMLALVLTACNSQPPPAPAPPGGSSGGSRAGGRGGTGAGGTGTAGTGGGSAADAPMRDAAATVEASTPDAATAVVDAITEPATDAGPDATISPPAAGQGPVATGTIAYSQDFEKGDMAGLGRSPASITADRVVVVDDPLGQRGKVLRIQWLPGDDFRSAPQFRPKTFVSNNSAFNYSSGDKISYAWGYMTDSTYIGATLAQNITGGDPIWMIQGRDEGILDIVPGLVRLPVRLQAKRWHDFRVDVDYLPGNAGLIQMYIDGQMVYSHRGGLPQGPRGHWDGGIYLTGFGQMGIGNNTARTVFFSNLSCGRR